MNKTPVNSFLCVMTPLTKHGECCLMKIPNFLSLSLQGSSMSVVSSKDSRFNHGGDLQTSLSRVSYDKFYISFNIDKYSSWICKWKLYSSSEWNQINPWMLLIYQHKLYFSPKLQVKIRDVGPFLINSQPQEIQHLAFGINFYFSA